MSGKKGVPHRRYSKEEKLRIIKEHLEEHKSIETIEREHHVGHNTRCLRTQDGSFHTISLTNAASAQAYDPLQEACVTESRVRKA